MELATLYAETRGRLLDLAASTDDERACTPVPALPGWTVKDAYAHLAGLCADMLDGRLDGVEELLELLMGLEEGLLLSQDHGGSLGQAKHRSVETNVLPQGNHFG